MLDSYYDIFEGRCHSRIRIAIKIPSGFDKAGAEILSLEELLDVHKQLIQPFYETATPEVPEYYPRKEISLLELKALIARRMLSECTICENMCRVDRTNDNRGICRVGDKSFYASEFVHVGEEPEIVPSHTVFFTGCTFKCVYCQNWDIAQSEMAECDAGYAATESLTEQIVRRANSVRNLNLVGGNPDQHMANIFTILVDLARLGYPRPVVWNSNNYMTETAVELLTGVTDLHLADFKYGNNDCAETLSKVKRYWDVITRNLLMEKRAAEILIRHLVLPGHVDCCTAKVVEWVAGNLPTATFNLMFQYRPEHLASEYPEINRHVSQDERYRAIDLATAAGVAKPGQFC